MPDAKSLLASSSVKVILMLRKLEETIIKVKHHCKMRSVISS